MLRVPVGCDAVIRAILAKRRHDYTIVERETAQCDGCEELAHARETIVRSQREQRNGFPRTDAPSRLACHLEDWGVQARRTRGSKKPAKGVERAGGRTA